MPCRLSHSCASCGPKLLGRCLAMFSCSGAASSSQLEERLRLNMSTCHRNSPERPTKCLGSRHTGRNVKMAVGRRASEACKYVRCVRCACGRAAGLMASCLLLPGGHASAVT